ncbi:general transcription factor II-I repeat domain-containing protein 2-like [Hypanus sabinus]|uniref:general transcription factor II-I repeat domain-containing protein 2-like n=2 Tax=Hypanus sabinus TaxID=79690 RepID=UPI0028C4E88A|nr:general transcription factor II-I repeat domain-containing protein 2-like [Hypanus sabinus]
MWEETRASGGNLHGHGANVQPPVTEIKPQSVTADAVRRKVLKRFVACLEEVKTFLGSKGLTFPELEQPEWLEKLHFMVDMTVHLNTLNTALQGKGRTALHMLEDVLAFERKLTVLARDLQKGTLSHFPNLREFKQGHDMIISEYLHSAIIAMQTSFGKRFCEFREEKNTLSFPVTPLSIDPSLLNTTALAGVSQPDLEMELADIADKDIWVSKFRRLTADLEDVARQKAVLAQKHKWSDIENLTDDSLRSCVKMKVTSYSPDVQTLCAEVQEQKSH